MIGRIVWIISLAAVYLTAADLLKIREYRLKKDETKKILVKYASSEKLLTFRWTLYKNEVLVVFSSYDGIVSQHLLRLSHPNSTLRYELKSRGAYDAMPPYMLIRFDAFEFATKQAKISLWLWDSREEVTIRYLDKKRG